MITLLAELGLGQPVLSPSAFVQSPYALPPAPWLVQTPALKPGASIFAPPATATGPRIEDRILASLVSGAKVWMDYEMLKQALKEKKVKDWKVVPLPPDPWYTNPWVIGGIAVGVVGLGFLFWKRK